jgi:D-3-phosphoglycerate dehydrogenase
MIGKFTQILGDEGCNISNMTNKSKGDYAYTIIDIESAVTDQVVEKCQNVDGVIRVRVVRKDI